MNDATRKQLAELRIIAERLRALAQNDYSLTATALLPQGHQLNADADTLDAIEDSLRRSTE